MKNKYALTIADIQLDVLSEAPQKEVDKISGIVDRRMREIYLNSRSCTRNEAALLGGVPSWSSLPPSTMRC